MAFIPQTYSLIRQLIELLSLQLRDGPNCGSERFDILDGTVGDWSESLSIFDHVASDATSNHCYSAISMVQND